MFRHFVLPIRVNNENLDDSRRVFYDELKDRGEGTADERRDIGGESLVS